MSVQQKLFKIVYLAINNGRLPIRSDNIDTGCSIYITATLIKQARMENLRKKLLALDGKGYKAYKDITGLYRYPDFELSIDHVQGDPFATPSRISIRINTDHAGFPEFLWQNNIRRIALEDYLGRAIKLAIMPLSSRQKSPRQEL